MADGDAPPERFDHVDTLTGQSLQIDSSPGFLRKTWICPLQKQESNTKAADTALSGIQTQLATWRGRYEPNHPHFEGVVLGFIDMHKLRSRLNVIPA